MKYILKLYTIFKRIIFQVLIKLRIMTFQNQTKRIIEDIRSQNEFTRLTNTTVNIQDVLDYRNTTGYVHLLFSLIDGNFIFEFEYIFGRTPNQNPQISDVLYSCTTPKVNHNTQLQINQQLNQFQNNSRYGLIDCFNRFYNI